MKVNLLFKIGVQFEKKILKNDCELLIYYTYKEST